MYTRCIERHLYSRRFFTYRLDPDTLPDIMSTHSPPHMQEPPAIGVGSRSHARDTCSIVPRSSRGRPVLQPAVGPDPKCSEPCSGAIAAAHHRSIRTAPRNGFRSYRCQRFPISGCRRRSETGDSLCCTRLRGLAGAESSLSWSPPSNSARFNSSTGVVSALVMVVGDAGDHTCTCPTISAVPGLARGPILRSAPAPKNRLIAAFPRRSHTTCTANSETTTLPENSLNAKPASRHSPPVPAGSILLRAVTCIIPPFPVPNSNSALGWRHLALL